VVAGIALAVYTGFSTVAQAATLWWDGVASTVNSASDNATTTAQNWLSGGNWDDGSTSAARATWTAGDHAVFGGSAASQTITAGTLTIGDMTFGEGAQGVGTSGTAYSITSGTLTLSSPSTITVNTPTIISSVLAGTGKSLTKAGDATLTLNGANSFTGGVTINGGIIELAGASGALASDVAIGLNGTLLFNRTANYVFAKSVSGSGALRQSQAYVELTANNPFTGTVTIDASKRMVLVNANAFAGAPKLVLNGQLTLGNLFNSGKAIVSELSGSSSGYVQNNYSTDGVRTLEVNQNTDTTFSGTFQDSGNRLAALIKSGTGTLTLGGASTHTGGTVIKEGALKISGSLAGKILVDTNGTLVLGKAATFTNAISGTGVIKSSLFGDVLLTGNNMFSGALQLDSDTRIVLNGTGSEDGEPALYMKGGQFTLGHVFAGGVATFRELSGTGEINPSYNSGTPRTLSVNQATSTTYTGTIVSTSSRWIGLAKSGAGTLTLAGGANAVNSDNVTVSGGTLQVGAVEASTTLFDQSHARTITVATNGTLRMLYRNAFGTIPSTPTTKLVINGGTVTSSTGSGGAVNILQDLTLKNNGILEVTKGVSYGTYQLQGIVTVAGSTPSAITNTGSTGWLTVGNGNNNVGVTVFDVADVTGNNDVDLTIAAVIKDSGQANRVGALTKTGVGSLLLSSTNLYTGVTTVSNGTFRLGVNNALTATNSMTLAGGILDAGNTTNTLGVLTVNADSMLSLNADSNLSFKKSADVSWPGKLSITGNIDFNRLRFGTDATGLSAEQLVNIRCNGYRVSINASGYINMLRGTLIQFH
jgi:autotransporter-associated beta strand protein